jgi:hypothetical protein
MTDQIATAEAIQWGDDFYEHMIEGEAAQDRQRRWFSIPLATHVEGNLWQGGCWPGVRVPDEFVYVLSLFPWEKYDIGPDTERDEVTMYDATHQGFEQVEELAAKVVDKLAEGPVLVHCQAGLNRSGLISARALMLMGDPAATAVAKLRKRSPIVLCNSAFENYLMGLDD